ncbi:hypothetical protein K6V82_07475 [Streptococcus gallolyticus]|nr:hypothetical protein [Streptococcus gallolyticus]
MKSKTKKTSQKRVKKTVWEQFKNFLLTIWLCLIFLIIFLLPFLFLPSEWEKLASSWELASPNPDHNYQVRPKTLYTTHSTYHHGGKHKDSYTEYFMELESDSDVSTCQILNAGVLEKSYHKLKTDKGFIRSLKLVQTDKKRFSTPTIIKLT